MKPIFTATPLRLRHQAGVSIVTAIFLLVVLSALGAAIVTLSTGQQISSALDLLGSRAYEAARSGVEHGLYRNTQANECGTTSFVPAAAPTMASFTVTVRCVATPTAGFADGKPLVTTITATACNQPAGGACPNPAPTSPDYVQRVVTVQF
ncbi:agglutinin biogenesis protein MshP [Massilia sp. Root418]|uniref:hypothetical protein n=1 Tax=Massilia sp. Root418 TaxID=1736532 RepID=UPI0006F8BC39|nr:hypothetical protein [Massilia sp. Root418]KQX01149.1 agglutinin biogenesis protein MshP [Massilia sp. Root418]